MKAKVFVLTGGPQAGKTSAIQALREYFGDKLLLVPEVATPLIGELWPEVRPESLSHEIWVKSLQRGIFHTQLGLEEISQARAATEGKILIGQDRGIFDSAAYLQITSRELAEQFGESYSHLMSRYHLVIHLETQAQVSASEFGSSTNASRFEAAEAAIRLDHRLWEAWQDHPHHIRIPATSTLKSKLDEVIELVQQLLD